MRGTLVLGMSAMLLGGCAIVSGGCDDLILSDLTISTRTALANEMEAAPSDAAWVGVIIDYLDLRGQVMACRGRDVG